MLEIGREHGKTLAQVALRFLIQKGIIVIPKSVHEERIKENFDVFDFALTDAEMESIEDLDTAKSAFFSHQDPKFVDWLLKL